MGNKISFLLLSFLLISSSTHVQSAEQGFISVDIFNKGIDFAKDVVINTAVANLTPLELPPIEKPVKIILIGTVHIFLSNMVLNKVEVTSSTVKAGGTGATVVASDAKAYLSMDWSYHYGSLIKISDKGTASVEVEGMEIGITLEVKNQKGTLQLSLLDCGCYVKDISIKLNGGASWLYQGLVDAFGGKIRSTVEDAITQKIEDEIVEFEASLQSLPKEVEVDDTASLNVSFVNDIVFSDSSIGFEINGLFIPRYEVVSSNHYVRNSQDSVSCEGPPKMVGISIHEKVLNSGSLVYYNADLMHWIIDKISDQSLLNTAEWRHLIPQLYKQYPNDDIILNVSITSVPSIKVARENIDVTVHLDVTIDVVDVGEVIPVSCISSVITLAAYPEISRNSLAGHVTLDDFSMSLKWSTIGTLHINLLKPIVETLVKTIVSPYVNLILWRGIPLPDFHGYTLHNARFSYISPKIIVCSDVAPLQHQGLSPLFVYDS